MQWISYQRKNPGLTLETSSFQNKIWSHFWNKFITGLGVNQSFTGFLCWNICGTSTYKWVNYRCPSNKYSIFAFQTHDPLFKLSKSSVKLRRKLNFRSFSLVTFFVILIILKHNKIFNSQLPVGIRKALNSFSTFGHYLPGETAHWLWIKISLNIHYQHDLKTISINQDWTKSITSIINNSAQL